MKYATDRETKESICVRKLVNASWDLVAFKIDPASVVFENNIPEDLPLVKGNFAQLQEVFFNIIDNAHHAMMEKKAAGIEAGYQPRISFAAQAQDGTVRITITDNGMGVRPENMRKLFTPLFSTKKEGKKGHGLGLYVMKQIVERNHGGTIELSSEYEKGVTIVVTLPFCQ